MDGPDQTWTGPIGHGRTRSDMAGPDGLEEMRFSSKRCIAMHCNALRFKVT